MCRQTQICLVFVHLSANNTWCLMCTLWQLVSLSQSADVGFLFPHFVLLLLVQLPSFLSKNIDDCMSVLVHTLCEVRGGDEISITVHSPSGWPFGVSSKEEKQNITVKQDAIRDLLLHVCNARFTHIDVFCWALSHIVFALDDWLLMLRHHAVLTDYDEGPHDTPFVCPLPCLDLWN